MIGKENQSEGRNRKIGRKRVTERKRQGERGRLRERKIEREDGKGEGGRRRKQTMHKDKHIATC